jgi:hypothetical protein
MNQCPMGKFRNSENWISSPFPKFRCVICFPKLESIKSKYQSGTKIPYEHSGEVWKQTKIVWHDLTQVLSRFGQCWQSYLPAIISSHPGHIFTRDSHTTGWPWHGEETLHRILAKLCTSRLAKRHLNSGRITLPHVRSRAQALGRALAALCVRCARSASVSRACTQPCPRAPIRTPGVQRSALHSASCPAQELQLRRALLRPPSLPEPRPPRPAPSSHFQAAPVTRLASPVAREAFKSSDPAEPHQRPRIAFAGLRSPAAARRPSNPVSHSQIPRTHVFLDLWWSSLTHSIGLWQREQAGSLAADELPRLRTRTNLLRPPPPMIRTSTWSPETPGPHPTPHRSNLAAGKPLHPFLPPWSLLH